MHVLRPWPARIKKRAWRFAKRHGIEDFYSDYEHLLAREDIDAIYIATTHNFHYENIIACLEHNKPVLCEKKYGSHRSAGTGNF